ncbi:MAG: hypothetical protein ACREVT_06410, partial [Burkholderiales bacterium]
LSAALVIRGTSRWCPAPNGWSCSAATFRIATSTSFATSAGTPTARAKAAWARLIRKVYEADPLECPKCRGRMRVIALIDDPTVTRRILEHLGCWAPEPSERGPPGQAPDWPANAVIPLTYHPVPDIA